VEHLYLWAPWFIVAVIVALVVWRGRHALNPRAIVIEALLVVVAYAAYYVVRGLTEGGTSTAIDNAQLIIDIERWLRIYREVGLQETVLRYDWLTVLFNWIYIWWHWPVIIAVAVQLYLNRPQAYRRYRDAFVLSGAVALVFFAAFPVAPPRLAAPDIVDTIALHSDIYRTYETPRFVNQYAAFPSLHFAWSLLVSIALVLETRHPLLRAIGLLSPPVVFLAIVVTGNHFFIDAVAGAILAVAALLVAHRYPLIPLPVSRGRATAG
jgi:hypothetical protein